MIQLPNSFALRSAQWTVVLYLNGYLEQIQNFFINEILYFETAVTFEVFHFLIQ